MKKKNQNPSHHGKKHIFPLTAAAKTRVGTACGIPAAQMRAGGAGLSQPNQSQGWLGWQRTIEYRKTNATTSTKATFC
jgi:hypothetical protein